MEEEPFGGQYIDGVNLYEFVRSNPITHDDPYGKDIYLKTGDDSGRSAVDALHQSVCVDEYDSCNRKIGKRCFSFAETEDNAHRWFALEFTWLGWSTGIGPIGPIYTAVGEIYETDGFGTVTSSKPSTPDQDKRWLRWMLNTRRGTQDLYWATYWNCRTIRNGNMRTHQVTISRWVDAADTAQLFAAAAKP